MADALEIVDADGLRGSIHLPGGSTRGALALTHGAGGSSESVLLKNIADAWVGAGFLVFRYDLPFRIRAAKGPPHPSKAAGDRDGVVQAVEFVRSLTAMPLVLAGHSYGGRQSSMVAAEQPDLADALLLLSYPLHPPGKPEKARTAHLPDITMPTVFVHGSKDPFGTIDEMHAALATIPASTTLIEITGAGHDLSAAKHRVSERTLDAAAGSFEFVPDLGSGDPTPERATPECST